MPSLFKASLVPIILSTTSTLVHAQAPAAQSYAPVQVTECPNGVQGWCYWASNDTAPPLCNSQCTTAINRLCAENLDEALQGIEQDCQIEYMPPIWPFGRNGAHPATPSETDCINNFNGILSNCGRDASQPENGVNQTYCTPSGGGGTYGWGDDGKPLEGSSRYIITTKGTDQRGQSKAPWQGADQCIKFDDSWVKPNDQVVLITDGPEIAAMTAPAAMASLAAAIPAPDPKCDVDYVCDYKGQPYYASSPVGPWQDGQDGMNRHRIIFEGWGVDNVGSLSLFYALHDRCQSWPYNWQVYKNGTQNVADFGLPSYQKHPAVPKFFDPGNVSDLCWCIPFAIFDASVGIQLPVSTFCPPGTQFPSMAEFAPARKRGLEHEEPGIFKSVDKVIAKREAMAKRDQISELVD